MDVTIWLGGTETIKGTQLRQWATTIHPVEWLKIKQKQKQNLWLETAGKNKDQWELSYIADAKWDNHFGKPLAFSHKIKHTIRPSNSTTRTWP